MPQLLLTISLKPTVPRGLGLRQGGCLLTGVQGAALNPQTDPREPKLGGPSRCWLCPCSPPGSPPLEDTPTLPLPAAQAPPPNPEPHRSGMCPGRAELGPETRPLRTRGPRFRSPGLPLGP